jgi:membrane protein implicated in regulation of membrane protease activity
MFGDCSLTYIIGSILIIILIIILLIIIICAPEANYACPGKEFILLILFYLYFLVLLGPFYATIILILILTIALISYFISWGRFSERFRERSNERSDDTCNPCESNDSDTEC